MITSFYEKAWEILSQKSKYPVKCHYAERQGRQYSDAKVKRAVSATQKAEAFLATLVIFTINYSGA